MKHLHLLFTIAIYALISQCAIASDILCNPNSMDYRPFIENGKQWIVVYSTNRIYWVKNYFIAGDTTISNHSCKKLMCQYINYDDSTNTTILSAIIFEEDKKVFYYPPEAESSNEPIMLYNFDVSIGDIVYLGGISENFYLQDSYLIQDTLILENNNECFRGVQAILKDGGYTINEGDTTYTEFQWYEGIGSVFEPFEKFEWNRYMGGPPCHLFECKINNEVIYSNTMGLTLSTNDAKYNSIINNKKQIIDGQLYILYNGHFYNVMGMMDIR